MIPTSSFAEDNLSVKRWIVDSKLLDNGSLEVSEDITYNFNDKFNGVYRFIALEDIDNVDNLRVSEMIEGKEVEYSLNQDAKKGDGNVYSYSQEDNGIKLMIFSPSKDEIRTFRIKYTLVNIAKKHKDIGEFYYKFLGDENETPIDYFSATIALPKLEKDKVKIFAHGSLNGIINFVGDNLIKLEVDNVPSNTFIEARVLFPLDYIPESRNMGYADYDHIMQEEMDFARELAEKATKRMKNKITFNYISIALAAIGTIFLTFISNKFRRDPGMYDKMDSLYPKDITPAELGLFMNHTITSRAIMATIFDLTRKGAIVIDEIEIDDGKKKRKFKDDFSLLRTNIDTNILTNHEKYMLNWLFDEVGDGKIVTTKDIETFRTKKPMVFSKSYTKWSKIVQEDLKAKEYHDPAAQKFGIITILICIVLFVMGVVTLAFGGLYGIALVIMSIITFIYGIILSLRKSDEGKIQYDLWKDYINEFKLKNEDINLDNIQITKDKALIYAIALGITMKRLENLRDTMPQTYSTNHFIYWYFFMNSKGGSAFEDRFNNSFYGSTGTSTPNSSSFGGGGGFTGGGGGGAGGGGTGGF